jgi:4-amino-4-deoxy-L-arabinose transferase-like glycosyltransferase
MSTRRAVWIPVLLTFVLYAITSTGRSLIDSDDAFYAHVAQQMLDRGDWVTPWANGVRFLEKPPLLYWLLMISYQILGVNEIGARLPTIAGMIAIVWLLFRMCLRAGESARAAIIASCAFAVSAGTFLFTRDTMHDICLLFFLVLAMAAFLDWYLDPARPLRPALLFYTALAGAMLSKSLIGVFFPLAIAAVFFAMSRDWPTLRSLHVIPGAALFLALAAPWHVLAALRNPGFLHHFFLNEQVFRFLNRREPMDFVSVPRVTFLLLVLVWFFPWTAFLPALARKPQSPLERLATAWTLTVLGFFTLSARLEHYALPALPAMSLLLGAALDRESRWVRRGFAALGGLGATAAAVWIAGAIWLGASGVSTLLSLGAREQGKIYQTDFEPLFDLPGPVLLQLLWPAGVTLAALAIGFLAAAWMERHRRRDSAAASVIGTAAAICLMIWWSYRVCDDVLSSRKFAVEVAARAQPGDRLVIVGDFESANSMAFYQRLPLQMVGGAPNLRHGLSYPDAPRLLITPGDLARYVQQPGWTFVLAPKSRLAELPIAGQPLLEMGGRVLQLSAAGPAGL